MSDVINGVPRQLLERAVYLFEIGELDGATAEAFRALLTAQPQASAAQSVQMRITGRIGDTSTASFDEPAPTADYRVQASAAQVSADDSRKLSDLGNELHNLSCHVVHVNEGWAEQIGKIACELWKWPQARAAQSAPAGEREAERSLSELMDEAMDNGNSQEWCDKRAVAIRASWQRTQSAVVQEKMQWPEIVELVNEVLGCEAHKFPCERGSIGHEMTGINFNSLARIIDRVRHRLAAPAQPAAQDQGEVQRLREGLVLCRDDAVTTLQNARHFEDAPNALVRIAKTADAALSASTGQEVKP